MTPHDWDRMLICRKCGQGLNAGDLIDGERPCKEGMSLRDEIAGFPIGSGYYGTSIATSEAREIADLILAHFNVTQKGTR